MKRLKQLLCRHAHYHQLISALAIRICFALIARAALRVALNIR